MRDLRQELFGAQDWVAELISNTKPEQYSLPTPCSEFTVKDLLDHYMCVCDKIESFPVDRTPAETRTVDDYLQEWNASSQRARAVWTDEAMDRDYTMSWGGSAQWSQDRWPIPVRNGLSWLRPCLRDGAAPRRPRGCGASRTRSSHRNRLKLSP